jgi:hypothetical protein
MGHTGAEWFLAQAEHSERQAQEAHHASLRHLYLLLARQWRQLAERAAERQSAIPTRAAVRLNAGRRG